MSTAAEGGLTFLDCTPMLLLLCFCRRRPLAQVYVRGELLGGCDIVLEMAEAGELHDTIEEMKARLL